MTVKLWEIDSKRKQLPQVWTFERNSIAYFWAKNRWHPVPTNIPRWERFGLKLEGQMTNLFSPSVPDESSTIEPPSKVMFEQSYGLVEKATLVRSSGDDVVVLKSSKKPENERVVIWALVEPFDDDEISLGLFGTSTFYSKVTFNPTTERVVIDGPCDGGSHLAAYDQESKRKIFLVWFISSVVDNVALSPAIAPLSSSAVCKIHHVQVESFGISSPVTSGSRAQDNLYVETQDFFDTAFTVEAIVYTAASAGRTRPLHTYLMDTGSVGFNGIQFCAFVDADDKLKFIVDNVISGSPSFVDTGISIAPSTPYAIGYSIVSSVLRWRVEPGGFSGSATVTPLPANGEGTKEIVGANQLSIGDAWSGNIYKMTKFQGDVLDDLKLDVPSFPQGPQVQNIPDNGV